MPFNDRGALRLRVVIRGAVQGVGFRPFIYRLATGLKLSGWVNNSSLGVFLEVEGPKERLESFLLRLEPEKPPRSFIQSLESTYLDPAGYADFEIRESEDSGEKTALVLPDLSICPECLADIRDPANRRYRYPFANCTNCGPRYSIIEALPYDRPNTSMRVFPMCDECRAEYDDPLDRRFHAQPNACPKCGPHLELRDSAGSVLASKDDALIAAADAIREGRIVAVKGIGGFHLMADARSEDAIRLLRERKRRDEKPLALLYPSVESVQAICEVSPVEERLLRSAESPIVLLRRRAAPAPDADRLANVAPGNPYLGVMTPYSPLHVLLMEELGFPVAATSGNLSDEPICIDEREALERLAGIADAFLVHDRPIVRHVDDSIVRVIAGREMILRRARGYAPLPLALKEEAPCVIAVGAHLKNSVAATKGASLFVSQHIGDLETAQAFGAFEAVIESFRRLYDLHPVAVACDDHPDYLSSRWARESGLPLVSVQHHYAHALACMVENDLQPPVLAVSWDGTGYGADGTIWGGEFLRIGEDGFERMAHLRAFPLPGGDKAAKEPRRCALGLLWEIFGPEGFEEAVESVPPLAEISRPERSVFRAMLEKRLNAPMTSSAGRLFDGVAALAGIRQVCRFEGQAAMELEFAAETVETEESYPFDSERRIGESVILDWEPMIRAIIKDRRRGIEAERIAAKFHRALVEMIVAAARVSGENKVALAGGCFQNRLLSECAIRRLREEGFRPYWHQRIPPNDGGIAVGQAVAALRELRRRSAKCGVGGDASK